MANTKQRPLVVALFPDRDEAHQAYTWLIDRGYTENELSVLMSAETREYFKMMEREQSTGSRTEAGVAIGAVAGAITGLVLVATIPGLALFAAGPLLAGLGGVGAGIVAGGLVGGMMDLSIPETYATAYERGLRAGGVVISVFPHRGDARPIETQFALLHGEDIHIDE